MEKYSNMSKRFLTVEQAVAYLETQSDSDLSDTDICQLPPDDNWGSKHFGKWFRTYCTNRRVSNDWHSIPKQGRTFLQKPGKKRKFDSVASEKMKSTKSKIPWMKEANFKQLIKSENVKNLCQTLVDI